MNVENIDSKVELRSNTFTPEMKKCSDKEENTSSSVSTPTEGPNHEEIDARSFKKPNGNNADANAFNGPAASAVSPSQGWFDFTSETNFISCITYVHVHALQKYDLIPKSP